MPYTLMLPASTVIVEAEGDMRSCRLNLAAVTCENLYWLHDVVIMKLRARDGCAIQIVMEHKAKVEQANR